jgi:hypothetical protein
MEYEGSSSVPAGPVEEGSSHDHVVEPISIDVSCGAHRVAEAR